MTAFSLIFVLSVMASAHGNVNDQLIALLTVSVFGILCEVGKLL